MSNFPQYPATSFDQAVDLTIFSSNQLSSIINGDAISDIEVQTGGIPTVRKALVDNFFFKSPILWVQDTTATIFNQLYYFYDSDVNNGWYYAPGATSTNPVLMGATPVGDANWRLYSVVSQNIPAEVFPWGTEITSITSSVTPPHTFDTAIVTFNGITLTDKDYTILDNTIYFTTPLVPEDDAEIADYLFCYLGKVQQGNPAADFVTYQALATNGSTPGATLVGTNTGNNVQQVLDSKIVSFQEGGKLLNANDQILDKDVDPNQAYRWDGVLPKTVSAGSTPDNSGGVGDGAWVKVGDASLRADLLNGDMTNLIGFSGYTNLTEFLHTTVRTVEEFRQTGFSDAQTFQSAVNSGSVRVPADSIIDITDNVNINIPADRLIIIDEGGILRSNGRFTAYGVNNVHWLINGLVESTGMIAAPAKLGWPNAAEGTQAGDERGFIEFGGVVFAGNDGANYSVTGAGRIQGSWSGTPNISDLSNQLNKKGIAAWNCSNFLVEGISIDGFEGEQVYWFSRNANNRDALFNRVKSTNARFNALNMNVYNATKNIRVINCYTNNSYNGIEASAGDVINTTHDGCINTGILFGLGTGGGNRLIDGNQVNDCIGTPYSLLYDINYESRGYVPNVKVTNNVATNPGVHFISIAGITGFKVANNTCYGLKTGRFIQATILQGGVIEYNTNYKPEPGTEHVYRGECYSVEENNNQRVLLGGSYVVAAASDHAITGGYSGAITTFGNRENFIDLRADNPAFGTGAELKYSVDIGAAFTPVSLSMQMTAYGVSGAQADWSINNLKINPGDVLGQSWVSRNTGHWEPGTDGTQNFGSPTRRVNNSYFTVAPTVTSNELAKTKLLELTEAERNAAMEIKANIRKYKLLDAIAVKGEGDARWHFGVGAQTVGEIMKKHGLNPADYGFWCYDSWEDQYEDVMEKVYTGNTNKDSDGFLIHEFTLKATGDKVLVKSAGENYGIRYDELSMFILSAI